MNGVRKFGEMRAAGGVRVSRGERVWESEGVGWGWGE